MSAIPLLTKAFFFRANKEKSGSVTTRPRPFSSLSLRLSGTTRIETDQERLISSPGSLTYVPCGLPYTTSVPEEGEMLILHFTAREDSPLFYPRPLSTVPPSGHALKDLYRRALNHSDSPYLQFAFAYQLLEEAKQIFFAPDPPVSPAMKQTKEYLEEHLCDPELTVEKLASLYGTSEVWFRKEFRRCYGASPLEYVKQRRLKLACQLLSTGLYSVTEVALRSGFESISYFSGEFRRLKGITPVQYKKSFGEK